MSGLIIPGGFGPRGSQGKLDAITYARSSDCLLGICFGMQLAVVEFCRTVLKIDANSTEIDPDCKEPVVCLISELAENKHAEVTVKGGTMRLGRLKTSLP